MGELQRRCLKSHEANYLYGKLTICFIQAFHFKQTFRGQNKKRKTWDKMAEMIKDLMGKSADKDEEKDKEKKDKGEKKKKDKKDKKEGDEDDEEGGEKKKKDKKKKKKKKDKKEGDDGDDGDDGDGD